jgi:hypothetical protein
METARATPGQVRAVIRRRAARERACAPRGCVLAGVPPALDVPARQTEEAHTPGALISNSRSKSPSVTAAQVHGIRSFFNCHDDWWGKGQPIADCEQKGGGSPSNFVITLTRPARRSLCALCPRLLCGNVR